MGLSVLLSRRQAFCPDQDSKLAFQALMVSTASRVGTGNIAGVATAIALGGPGAVFWPDTVMVSVMTANNEVGTVQPIKELAALAHEHNVPFHTDAVQAYAHVPLDVEKLGVDALSVSAHKFHGPKGVGFLYCKRGLKTEPLISGGAQERGYRAGTENLACIIGMAMAAQLTFGKKGFEPTEAEVLPASATPIRTRTAPIRLPFQGCN